MAGKTNKENGPKKAAAAKSTGLKKTAPKAKKAAEDNDLDLEGEETIGKTTKKSFSGSNADEDEEDFVEEIEEDDDSLKKGEGEDWDPDFNEFDLPKSSKKTSLKKSSKDNDDDFKVDDEFKDYFGSKSSSRKYNRDDDDY